MRNVALADLHKCETFGTHLIGCNAVSATSRSSNLGYVYTRSDTLRSVLDRIHSVYKGPVRNWNCTIPYGIALISGPIWCQIADPIRIGSTRSQAYPYQFRTCSKRIPFPVNAALVYVLPFRIVDIH